MYRPDGIRGFLGRDALQDAVGHLDEGYLQAEMAGDGCGFQPDIPAAYDQQPTSGFHLLAETIGIPLVADHIDPGQITAQRCGKPAWRRSRGNRQRVIGVGHAVLGADVTGLPVISSTQFDSLTSTVFSANQLSGRNSRRSNVISPSRYFLDKGGR